MYCGFTFDKACIYLLGPADNDVSKYLILGKLIQLGRGTTVFFNILNCNGDTCNRGVIQKMADVEQ